MDDAIGGGVVVLLCFIVMVMLACIWFFLCYCICRAKRDYKQTKKYLDDLASRSFRQHLYHHQQSREMDYSRLTSNHQQLRPQTPRLDHPRFQRTFLSDLARSQSMEIQPSSLPNQRAPLTTSTPIQGGMVPSLHSVGSRIPNVTSHSRPQHFILSEQLSLSTSSHQPSHGLSRSHLRYQSDSNIRNHPSTQHRTHLQQSNSNPQRSTLPTSRQSPHSSRPPRIVLGTPNSDRLQSVREFEEMDVQAEPPGDPPRYSILFPSNYREAYKGPMPFSFSSPPPGSRSQGWRQPPPTRNEFSQLSSWPQHLT